MMNQRVKKIALTPNMAVVIAALVFTTLPARSATPNVAPPIAALVAQLGDASPAVRDTARAEFSKIGRPARAALLAASVAGPVRQRQAARELLRALPLFDDSDAAPLRDALAGYAATPPVARADHALRLLSRSGDAGLMAVARIILETPDDDDTLWTIVARLTLDDQKRVVASHDFATNEPAGPARLYLAGSAAFDLDRPRAVELLTRAPGELSIARPAALPVLRRLGNLLAADAQASGDAARELRVRCDMAMLAPTQVAATVMTPSGLTQVWGEPEASDWLLSYFETRLRLHSINGFAEDLTRLGVPDADPTAAFVAAVVTAPRFQPAAPVPDAVAHDMMSRMRGVPSAVWKAIDGMNASQAITSAELLTRSGESALADAVTTRLLISSPSDGATPSDSRLRLLVLVVQQSDDAHRAAAFAKLREELKKSYAWQEQIVFKAPNAMRGLIDVDQTMLSRPVDELVMPWLAEMRRAFESHDDAATDAVLDRLALVDLDRSEFAIDAIYVLEARGRVEEADEIYLTAMHDARAMLDATPDDPNAMNRVAWLCGRTGHELELAYALATRALKNAPDAARLDTFAETAHRLGKAQEAIDAETRALELKPGDEFMTRQLDRFKAGLAPGDAERALWSESWER